MSFNEASEDSVFSFSPMFPLHLPYEGKCQNNGRPEMTDRRWRPDMADRRWRPDMTDRRWRPDMTDRGWRPDTTESPSTGSGGQSSVLCPDGLPTYREILHPHNTVIQSVHNLHLLSIHIFQHCGWPGIAGGARGRLADLPLPWPTSPPSLCPRFLCVPDTTGSLW